jgi:1-acyl-sn-glycerol-3-phosphate acyltransferase
MNSLRRAENLTAVNRPPWLLLRFLLRIFLRLPIHLLKGLRVQGAHNLPRQRRPLILACNHAAFIDSIYIILAVAPRFTICGAKPRLFRAPTRRALMALANILKVDGHPRFLNDCKALLEAGEILLIYPEMGRYAEGLGPFKTWAAEVALATGTSILPCYLYGTTSGHHGAPRLIVGEELRPSGDADTLTAQLRQTISALAPPEAGLKEGAG